MSYLEVFGVLAVVGVDVSKFFGVAAGVLKHGTRAESESEKCDSAHLCPKRRAGRAGRPCFQLKNMNFQWADGLYTQRGIPAVWTRRAGRLHIRTGRRAPH